MQQAFLFIYEQEAQQMLRSPRNASLSEYYFRFFGIQKVHKDHTVLPAHPRTYPQSDKTIPAFAFPAKADTHLPTPEGWKAE